MSSNVHANRLCDINLTICWWPLLYIILSDYIENVNKPGDTLILNHIPEAPKLPSFTFKSEYYVLPSVQIRSLSYNWSEHRATSQHCIVVLWGINIFLSSCFGSQWYSCLIVGLLAMWVSVTFLLTWPGEPESLQELYHSQILMLPGATAWKSADASACVNSCFA